ncbi:hypothetical protein ON010_g587 [Phytophthora cinnamomi]|nr:hypothetical protein ON010_g587 [Phytophthora cinnamomi]
MDSFVAGEALGELLDETAVPSAGRQTRLHAGAERHRTELPLRPRLVPRLVRLDHEVHGRRLGAQRAHA